jgi:hypothetical protein
VVLTLLDVAAWWGESALPAFEVATPPGVDLLATLRAIDRPW